MAIAILMGRARVPLTIYCLWATGCFSSFLSFLRFPSSFFHFVFLSFWFLSFNLSSFLSFFIFVFLNLYLPMKVICFKCFSFCQLSFIHLCLWFSFIYIHFLRFLHSIFPLPSIYPAHAHSFTTSDAFLDAFSHLYKRVCRSVSPSVHRSHTSWNHA